MSDYFPLPRRERSMPARQDLSSKYVPPVRHRHFDGDLNNGTFESSLSFIDSLSREERTHERRTYVREVGGREVDLPPFLLRFRYTGTDAYGTSLLLRDVDLVARRATTNLLEMREGLELSPRSRPLSPTVAGTEILDIAPGSIEVVETVYGLVATVAQSEPVSLLGFFSMLWSSTRWGRAIWQAKIVGTPEGTPEQTLQTLEPAALLPVCGDAVGEGFGLEINARTETYSLDAFVPPEER